MHDHTAPVDPRTLTGKPSGGTLSITHARIEIMDGTLVPGAVMVKRVYPTPP